MMYCVLNDCECYLWGCIDVISITMNDFQDCPYAIIMLRTIGTFGCASD